MEVVCSCGHMQWIHESDGCLSCGCDKGPLGVIFRDGTEEQKHELAELFRPIDKEKDVE